MNRVFLANVATALLFSPTRRQPNAAQFRASAAIERHFTKEPEDNTKSYDFNTSKIALKTVRTQNRNSPLKHL